jgi:UDP-glucose 6-dehydrogenase
LDLSRAANQTDGERRAEVGKIAMIGTGYVGRIFGLCLSDLGHHEACVGMDLTKINCLNTGEIPVSGAAFRI